MFIIFSWNFPLFWSSLQSYMAAGWGRRVVVLDNSASKRVLRDPCEPQNRPSTTHLQHSQWEADHNPS